jgi:2-dehydro-3-deoxyphosphogluconate aldolase/(4S)-4-hydroxy-2-oxoglutarate aldolase
MQKIQFLKRIVEHGVVAVIRATHAEEAIKIANACIDGGISAIEVTFTVPGAKDVIEKLSLTFHQEKLLIGAGTVLDSETARIAILAGANFIVSPSFDEQTAKLCHRYQIPYLPGCLTITEMVKALESGVDIIKLFPGSAFGPSYVKAIKGPLPYANLMPTGGVSLENIEEWVQAGVIAVGIGSELTKPALSGHYDEVTLRAKAFISAFKKAKENLKG